MRSNAKLSPAMEAAIKVVETMSPNPVTGAKSPRIEILMLKSLYYLAKETLSRAETMESMACDMRMSAQREIDEIHQRIKLLELDLGVDEEDPHEGGVPA